MEDGKEYKPLREWEPFKVGERFVRKDYDDCRDIIVVHSANLPTFTLPFWMVGTLSEGLSFFDGILYTPLDRDTVEPEPSKPIEIKTTAWRDERGSILNLEPRDNAAGMTLGDVTTTTQDGKCIRVVWEPRDG